MWYCCNMIVPCWRRTEGRVNNSETFSALLPLYQLTVANANASKMMLFDEDRYGSSTSVFDGTPQSPISIRDTLAYMETGKYFYIPSWLFYLMYLKRSHMWYSMKGRKRNTSRKTVYKDSLFLKRYLLVKHDVNLYLLPTFWPCRLTVYVLL